MSFILDSIDGTISSLKNLREDLEDSIYDEAQGISDEIVTERMESFKDNLPTSHMKGRELYQLHRDTSSAFDTTSHWLSLSTEEQAHWERSARKLREKVSLDY